MAAKNQEQLPAGWTEECKIQKGGRKARYYVNSETGQKFYSKDDLFRYIKTQSPQLLKPQPDNTRGKSHLEHANVKVEANGTDHPEWLPDGWTIEMKTRQSGSSAGKPYKIYIDPVTGSKFFSKPEVLRHLESVRDRTCTAEGKQTRDSLHSETKVLEKSTTNDVPAEQNKGSETIKSAKKEQVLAKSTAKDIPTGSVKETRSRKTACIRKEEQVLEKSTEDDLPPGWIKEIKTRKSGSQIKKDPFYTDPVNGYVFRSKRDVLRYLETGDTSKCKIKPKECAVGDGELIDAEVVPSSVAKRQKSEHPTTRRQLFLGKESPHKTVLSNSAESNRRRSTRLSANTDYLGAPATENSPEKMAISRKSSHASGSAPSESAASMRRRSKRLSTEALTPDISPQKLPTEKDVKSKSKSRFTRSAMKKSECSNENQAKNVFPGGENHQGQNLLDSGATDRKRKSSVGSRKSKSGKKLDLPRRSSNRLAGSEPETGSVCMTTERVFGTAAVKSGKSEDGAVSKPAKGASSRMNVPSRGEPSNKSKSVEAQAVAVTQEQQLVLNPKETITDKSEQVLSLSFGDSLLDPCLESAFKALIGETPEDGVPADSGPDSTPSADIIQDTKAKRTRERKTGTNLIKSKKQKLDLPRRSSQRIAGITKGDLTYAIQNSSNGEAFADANGASSEQLESGQGAGPENLDSSNINSRQSSIKGKMPINDLNVKEQLPNIENEETVKEKLEKQPQAVENKKTDNGNPETPYPFGDSFSDPCLEFAFKTLTGAIPVEESLTIQDYFQNQADPPETQKNGDSAASDFTLPTSFQNDASVHFNAPENQLASQRQLPVNTSLPPSGNVSLPTYHDTAGEQQPFVDRSNQSDGKA